MRPDQRDGRLVGVVVDMTETLRDKLIRCGWASNFSVDTLVGLIEKHYAALAQPEPEGPTDKELYEA